MRNCPFLSCCPKFLYYSREGGLLKSGLEGWVLKHTEKEETAHQENGTGWPKERSSEVEVVGGEGTALSDPCD